jgi:hypothetical protein
MRWLFLAGRIGTLLVAVGLALLLVSLIPPARTSSFTSGGPYLAPQSFQTFGPMVPMNITYDRPFLTALTPQQELEIELTCNGTLDIYVLKTDKNSFLANFENGKNVSALESYLQAHSEIVGLHNKISSGGKVSYVPTEVINATVILSNASQNTIVIQNEVGSIFNLLVPWLKAQTLAIFLIPIGLLLALFSRLTRRQFGNGLKQK